MSRGLENDDVRMSRWIREQIERGVREELEHIIPGLTDRLLSRVLDIVECKKVQRIRLSVKDHDPIWGEVREESEHSSSQSVRPVRPGKRPKREEVRNLLLRFKKPLPSSFYTEKKLDIFVELIDANTGHTVESGPESSVEVEVVVLEGDSETGGNGNRTQEGYEKYVVKGRRGKALLIGKLKVNLKGGIGELSVEFTEVSKCCWSRAFRLAVRESEGRKYIHEVISDPIIVKSIRGETNEKHDPPQPDDEVWRLVKIGRNGPFCRKLGDAGIRYVREFVQLLNKDEGKLKDILGKTMTDKNWRTLTAHAKKCPMNEKRDADKFSPRQENHEDTSGKASSSFPSQVSERQTENPAPVQHDMAPRTCASVGPEAPLVNARSTAEGVTAVPPFAQSPNTRFENPTGFLANEVARPASLQPTSANNWNDRISPGDDGITIGGLQTRSYDINLRYAMPSQMVNKHVLPPGPTCASISSFQNGYNGVTTLPLPAQSENTHFGNPARFAANEIARPAAHQPTSANNLNGEYSQFVMHSQMINSRSQTVNEHFSASNSSFQNGQNGPAPLASNQPISANNWSGLISRGDNGTTIGELPAQPHGINFQYAMSCQMANPSGPTCGSVSSFQSTSTLPVPGGNPTMEGDQSTFSDWEIEYIIAPLDPPHVDTFLPLPPED